MTERTHYADNDPRHHSTRIKTMLREVMEHAREDVTRVSDPKAQALFETSAEVLDGLITAYEHFEQKNETAWQ